MKLKNIIILALFLTTVSGGLFAEGIRESAAAVDDAGVLREASEPSEQSISIKDLPGTWNLTEQKGAYAIISSIEQNTGKGTYPEYSLKLAMTAFKEPSTADIMEKEESYTYFEGIIDYAFTGTKLTVSKTSLLNGGDEKGMPLIVEGELTAPKKTVQAGIEDNQLTVDLRDSGMEKKKYIYYISSPDELHLVYENRVRDKGELEDLFGMESGTLEEAMYRLDLGYTR